MDEVAVAAVVSDCTTQKKGHSVTYPKLVAIDINKVIAPIIATVVIKEIY